MATQPTPAELRAKADQEDRDAAAKRDEEQRHQNGILEFLRGLVPNFSFGGLLEIGLILTGVYFLARTEWGSKMLDGLVNMLPESWRAAASGLLNKIGLDVDMGKSLQAMDYTAFHTTLKDQASPEVLEAIDPDDHNVTLNKVLAVVRDANGGKVTLKGLTSPETIKNLILREPEITKNLVVAALKPGADGKPSATATQLNASLKTLIADPKMLDELLAPAVRVRTISVLAAALPANAPVSEASLADMIAKGLDADGKAKPELRQILSDAVDGNVKAALGGVYTMVGAEGIVRGIDESKLTSDAGKYAIATAKTNPKAMAAFTDLIGAVGIDKAKAFIDAFQTQDGAHQAIQLLLTKDNVKALPQAVALLDQLPDLGKKLPIDDARKLAQVSGLLHKPAYIPAITNIVNNDIKPLVLADDFIQNGQVPINRAVDMIMNPKVRKEIVQAGTENLVALAPNGDGFLTKRNLDAVLRFADAIATPDNQAASDNSRLIMRDLAALVTSKPAISLKKAFENRSNAQIAAFFSVPANRAAVKELFDPATGITSADPKIQQEIALLHDNFINPKYSNVGLGAILSDEKAVKFLLDNTGGGKKMGYEWAARADMAANDWNGALNVKENQDILLELGKVLNSAPTAQTTPAPTPAKRPQARV
jgi:hypothetical protein